MVNDSSCELLADYYCHTASLDTIFVQIYIDTLPGSQGCQKIRIFCWVFVLELPQKGTKSASPEETSHKKEKLMVNDSKTFTENKNG